MKKYFLCLWMIILILALSACSKSVDKPNVEKWDCTVNCAEKSGDNSYIITYSDKEILSSSGMLSFQNPNDFDIVVHILTNGEEERTTTVKAGGVVVLHQVKKDVIYTIGCHADVKEGTEIKLTVYDGEHSEPY